MKYIDGFLNQITMYRLVFYFLIFLLSVATVYSFLGILPFGPIALLFSAIFLFFVCLITNKVFAYVFEAPVNIESVYITALILALIITPLRNYHDLPFLFWAGVWAIASKFIFAINRKHIFNPAAFAVALTAITSIGSASWWIGTLPMAPFIFLGILIVMKIKRFNFVFYFFIFAIVTILGLSMLRGSSPVLVLRTIFFESPILFFAFIMLTEPLTTPSKKFTQSIYGALVGVLFSPQLSVAGFYTTPEIALLIGNVFSYIVSFKQKLILHLAQEIAIGRDLVDFIYIRPKNFLFTPGQYMEWTLAHNKADSRGNRRYYTIASSPTEDAIRLGIKFHQNGSSYKRAMIQMQNNSSIVAGDLRGDFVLPKDQSRKLVFIAGGIGITPFRAIIKYLTDKNEKRDIILFYANKTEDEIVYKDVFDEAAERFGLNTIYLIERLTADRIKQDVPDFAERTFYLSGPNGMVEGYKNILKQMGVRSNQIITDYFPGY